MKNILFFSYWDFGDPLTTSTVVPHLRILKSLPSVNRLIFVNVQRRQLTQGQINSINQLADFHYPFYYSKYLPSIGSKGLYYLIAPFKLKSLNKKHSIDLIFTRGAMAGSIGYLSSKITNTPFVVESFEPHSWYMRDTKVWSYWDPRYIIQNYLEQKQIYTAKKLLVVSSLYKSLLLAKGIDSTRIDVNPCAVNGNDFFIDDNLRNSVRIELKIHNSSKVGIYVGKFGGLYYDQLSYEIFRTAFNIFGDKFYLIVLSSVNENDFYLNCQKHGIPLDRTSLIHAAHENVNRYLNAADFAFANYKPTASSSFLSPVKVGEYWACGLPILITKGIGDEQVFVEKEGLGVIVHGQDLFAIESAIKELKDRLPFFNKQELRLKGTMKRSFETIISSYKKIVS